MRAVNYQRHNISALACSSNDDDDDDDGDEDADSDAAGNSCHGFAIPTGWKSCGLELGRCGAMATAPKSRARISLQYSPPLGVAFVFVYYFPAAGQLFALSSATVSVSAEYTALRSWL